MGPGADGVHLPSRSIPIEIVREHAPKEFLIGVSTHSSDEISAAKQAGADFAVLGPIFETPGKPKTIGLDEIKMAKSTHSEFPILGLGGICESNYRDVLAAGADGFAAIRFLNTAEKIERVSRELGL